MLLLSVVLAVVFHFDSLALDDEAFRKSCTTYTSIMFVARERQIIHATRSNVKGRFGNNDPKIKTYFSVIITFVASVYANKFIYIITRKVYASIKEKNASYNSKLHAVLHK